MNRRLLAILCAAAGLLLLFCGLLAPIHIEAVDMAVIRRAGQGTPTVVDLGMALLREENLGAAQLLAKAAAGTPGADDLKSAADRLADRKPELQPWGGGSPRFASLLQTSPAGPPEPFADFALRLENRGRLLDALKASSRPEIAALLRCRLLTNTVIFEPSGSSAGQALDGAISIAGLLIESGRLSPGLTAAVESNALKAVQGGSPGDIEEILLDLISLAQRLNWNQLCVLVEPIESPETLRALSDQARQADNQSILAEIYAAVRLTGRPDAVARYIAAYSQSGLPDLAFCVRFGAGGLNELLNRGQRLHVSGFRMRLASSAPLAACIDALAGWCWRAPRLGMVFKWGAILAAGFLIALAARVARPAALDGPARRHPFWGELLFAAGFLIVILIASEPFYGRQNPQPVFSLRLRIPTDPTSTSPSKFMDNPINIVTLAVFFVIQGLLYIVCRVKLAEILRQRIPLRLKLRLLDNDDHLFDAGLYLGFVGTIISLILVSMGVIKFSLMAAYSSTSFGIIFVSIFKIFHLRGARRALLIEIGADAPEPAAAPAPSPAAAAYTAAVSPQTPASSAAQTLLPPP